MAKKPKNLIQYARQMRKSMTPSEEKLWQHLRSKRFGSLKWRCQHPIPPYIVDFFCPSLRLVIELDGESHDGKEAYDLRRQNFLESQGLIVLRFWDSELFESMSDVLSIIEDYCLQSGFYPPPPRPLPQGEGG
jgi:very-short-patch-repair endonuclease